MLEVDAPGFVFVDKIEFSLDESQCVVSALLLLSMSCSIGVCSRGWSACIVEGISLLGLLTIPVSLCAHLGCVLVPVCLVPVCVLWYYWFLIHNQEYLLKSTKVA